MEKLNFIRKYEIEGIEKIYTYTYVNELFGRKVFSKFSYYNLYRNQLSFSSTATVTQSIDHNEVATFLWL